MSDEFAVTLAYVERVQTVAAERERAAIVAWLLGNGLLHIAYTIESGEPLAGDDE